MNDDDRAANRQSHAEAARFGRIEGRENSLDVFGMNPRGRNEYADAYGTGLGRLGADRQLARFLRCAGLWQSLFP